MKKIFSILSAGLSAVALSALATGCVEEVPEVIEEIELSNLLTPSSTSAVVDATVGTSVNFTWTNSNATVYYLEVYSFETGAESTPATAADITEEMLTETNLAWSGVVEPSESGSSSSKRVDDLDPEMSYYARVRAQSSADPDTKTTGDSKWAIFPYPIDTYSVMDQLPSFSVKKRTSTTITVRWTVVEGDTDGINQIRVSPHPTDETQAFLQIPVEAGAVEATIGTETPLKPSVKYTVALHFNSANRGQMFVWTTPDFTQAQYAKDTAELKHYLREAASIKDGVPMKIVLTNLDTPYDLDGSADILGPVEILGQQSADGSQSPVIKGRLDIMAPLTQTYSYATADPAGINPDGIAGTVDASAENPTAGATSVRIEAIEFDGDSYTYDRPLSLSSLKYPVPEGSSEDSGPFFSKPLSVYIVNCDIHGYSAGFFYDNSKPAEFTEIVVDNNTISDTQGSGGDGFDLRAATTIGYVSMTNNTFSNGMRTFVRIDKGTLKNMEFANNTVNNLASVDDGNNKGLFNIRATLSGDFTITDNLFLNLNGCPARTVMFPTQATAFPTGVSGNYYYNLADTFFYDKEVDKCPSSDEFPESKAIAGGGSVLSADPCENSVRGIFNVTDAAVLAAKAGDPRWLVEYIPQPIANLEPVAYGEWNLTDKSAYGQSLEETTVINNTKFIVTSNPINVLDEGMEFSAEATLQYGGVPSDCAIAFLVDKPGSIFASSAVSGSGTVNDHITVAIGDADGNAATVAGSIFAGASNQKIVFDDIDGPQLIYLYACGPVVLTDLEWSDDVNTGSSALKDPEVTADVSTAGALKLSWPAVENAGSYIISFGSKEADAEYAEDEYTVTATSPEYAWENFPSGTYTVNVQAVPAEPDKFENSMIVGKEVTVKVPELSNMTSGRLTQEDFKLLAALTGGQKVKQEDIVYKNFMFTNTKDDKVNFNVDSNFGAYYNTGGKSTLAEDANSASQTIRFLAAGNGKLSVIAASTSDATNRHVGYAFGETSHGLSEGLPAKPSAPITEPNASFEITATAGQAIDIYADANVYIMSVTWEPSGQLPAVAGLTPVTEATTWGSEVWNEFYSHRTDQTVKYGSDFTIDKDYYVINNLMIYPTAGQKIRVSETSSGSGTYYLQLQGGDGSYADGPSADATDAQLQGYSKNFIRFRANGNGTLTLTARHTSGTAGSGRFVCVAVGGSADAVGVGTIQPTRFDAAQHTSFTEQSWDITASNGDAITIVVTNSLRIGEITWTPAQ